MTSIADVYDALTTQRPYGRALSHREAMALICNRLGAAFDPRLLEGLISLLGQYAVGSSVTLSNGCVGRVVMNDPANPAVPSSVMITQYPDGTQPQQPVYLDLRCRRDVSLRDEAEDDTFDAVYRAAIREQRHFLSCA